MIKIPTATFVFFFGIVIRWSYRLSWQRPGMVSNPTSCFQCLSHWISHWRSNMNEKISHHLHSPVYWLSLFFNSCFIQTCSTRLSLPANSNTSKILGVSIPNCVCVTKHKTNICCRGKQNTEVHFKGLLVIFTLGVCQREVNAASLLPSLSLSHSPLFLIFLYKPCYFWMEFSGMVLLTDRMSDSI